MKFLNNGVMSKNNGVMSKNNGGKSVDSNPGYEKIYYFLINLNHS